MIIIVIAIILASLTDLGFMPVATILKHNERLEIRIHIELKTETNNKQKESS